MSFRIGRKHAQHAYPTSRAASSVPYARNFAAGPTAQDPISVTPATSSISWTAIESGAAPGPLVPITPKSTGIIRIQGVVVVKSNALTPVELQVLVKVNGGTLLVPLFEVVSCAPNVLGPPPPGGFTAIPFLTETPFGAPLPIGVAANVEIALSANDVGLFLIVGSSTLDVQEVQAATG